MTQVSDGVYVEHSWGQNSGHIGIPMDAIPKFIRYLSAFSPEAAAAATKAKSPVKAAPVSDKGKGIVKKGKEAEKKEPKEPKKPKEKKEPEPKKTIEDLDAELLSYQSERSGAASAPAEAAEAAE